jgi:hypothetical protein
MVAIARLKCVPLCGISMLHTQFDLLLVGPWVPPAAFLDLANSSNLLLITIGVRSIRR